MKYRLDNAHRAFFLEQGAITFQSLLTAEEAEACAVAIDAAVETPTKLRYRIMEEVGVKPKVRGRDQWRVSESCRKWVMDRRCAQVAKELTDSGPLRLLADQRCGGDPSTWLEQTLSNTGASDIATEEAWTLENHLCYQGIVCGLLLCLRAPADAPPSFVGTKPGMGTYFSPKYPLVVDQLLRGPDYLYLLVAYGKAISVFVHQPLDPQMQSLRELGYHYGDRLKDHLHPIVCR